MARPTPDSIAARRAPLGVPDEAFPRSVAVIMDGNGRWARARDLPRTAGHRIRKSTLRAEGLGLEARDATTLWLAPGEEAYVPLEREDLDALVAAARGD